MTNHEINLRLAREVMGWEVLDEYPEDREVWPFYVNEGDQVSIFNDIDDEIDGGKVWSPCTDANHADQITETLAGEIGSFVEQKWLARQKTWEVRFVVFDKDKMYTKYASHKSRPMAICLAAIAVLDARKEKTDANQ